MDGDFNFQRRWREYVLICLVRSQIVIKLKGWWQVLFRLYGNHFIAGTRGTWEVWRDENSYRKMFVPECNGIRFDIRERVCRRRRRTGHKRTRKENDLEYLLLNQVTVKWMSWLSKFGILLWIVLAAYSCIRLLRRKLKAGLGYDPIVNRIGEGYKIGAEIAKHEKISPQGDWQSTTVLIKQY